MIDVVRSQPAPPSLVKTKRYNGKDVREQLHSDFLAKCYLCEGPLPVGTMQVDHLRGRVPADLVHDWTNLFPACKCNQHRPKNLVLPLLDPAGNQQVETRLVQILTDKIEPAFAAVDPTDLEAVNTANELTHIHQHALHGRDLQSAIKTYLGLATMAVLRYERIKADAASDAQAIAEARTIASGHLRRTSPFSALVRGAIQKCIAPELWAALT